MARKTRFVVALYAPHTRDACDALGDYLEAAGLRVTLKLPEPAPVEKLRYGMLPWGSYQLALRNGKVPTANAVDVAVNEAFAKLKTRFGEAALDLNGVLLGTIPERRS